MSVSPYLKDRQRVSTRCGAIRHIFKMMNVVIIYDAYLDRFYSSLFDDIYFILICWKFKNS